MHVVFVNRFYYPDHSATAQMLRDLATQLADGDHRVSVITSKQTYNDEQTLASKEHFEGVDIIRIPGTHFGRSSNLLRFLDTLSFHILIIPYLLRIKSQDTVVVSKTDPPLIHIVVQAIAHLKGIPSVVWLQDVYPELLDKLSCTLPRLPYKLMLSIRNWALKRADAVVVIGDQMQQHVATLQLPGTPVHQIPNWNPSNSIHQVQPSDNSLIATYNPDGKFVVMYSGNLGLAHDFETLLAAAIELQEHASIQFVLIGSGSKMDQFKQSCSELNLTNVSFHPYQPLELVSSSLSCADVSLITLLPGLNKYLYPSKLYGALAVGKPVLFVGDKDSDIAHELLANNAGIHVNNSDTASLVTAILALSQDEQRRNIIGNNALALYDNKFRYGISLETWETVLAEVHSAGTASYAKTQRPSKTL